MRFQTYNLGEICWNFGQPDRRYY